MSAREVSIDYAQVEFGGNPAPFGAYVAVNFCGEPVMVEPVRMPHGRCEARDVVIARLVARAKQEGWTLSG